MDLLIQFPTRKRKEKFLTYLSRYVETLSGANNVTININCDIDDEEMNNEETVSQIQAIFEDAEPPPGNGIIAAPVVNFDDNLSKIEAVNRNLDDKSFDVVILASDDMWPMRPNWDEEIRKGYKEFFPDYDGVLHFNDGYVASKLNTLCILGKPYYDRFGYIYHPDYKSVFCDNEFMNVSRNLSKAQYLDTIIIEHRHFIWMGEKKDVLYKANDMHDKSDADTFFKRSTLDFPLESILSPLKQPASFRYPMSQCESESDK